MRCLRIVAFVAVMFGEKARCRAIHERASASIDSGSPSLSSYSTATRSTVSFTTSSSPSSSSSFTTQLQLTACSPASTITTTVTITVAATAPISTTLSGTRGKETTTQSPTPQPTSGNITAQIIGIAIGSSTIVGIVAAFFFFAGHCSNRRRPSIHSISPNLESWKRKLDKRWKKKLNRKAHLEHARTFPAELESTPEVREVSMPPQRPVNNAPFFRHPVMAASSVAREIENDIRPDPPSPLPAALLQPLRVEIPPVELPTFDDPGTSPLPVYEELDAARRYQIFSWAAPEATYRPDKFTLSDMI